MSMPSSICSTTLSLNEAKLYPGFCAGVLPLDNVDQVRSIESVGPTDFLALERGTSSVIVGEDLDGDGIPESIRTLVTANGLNQGLATTSTHLYASSSSTVYRWQYNATTKTVVENSSDSPETIIININEDGTGGAPFGHTTRTLVVDELNDNILYVSVGSYSNIDENSFRSRIRSFSLLLNDDASSSFPLDFVNDGNVFADGLRNEVGMELDEFGILWGVGNSADNLNRDDLGGRIFNDNPAEEMHRLEDGQNYGYPYCWREYDLYGQGLGRGTAWAWPNSEKSDEQCRNDYDIPQLAMQAHSAPLGITFYKYRQERPSPQCDNVLPFPVEVDGWAFVAFHGSWNRDVPTGYKVVMIPMDVDANDGKPVVKGGIGADPIDLLAHDGTSARWDDGFRPVDVTFDGCGRLLVSSDGSRNNGYIGSKIVRIESTMEHLATSHAEQAYRALLLQLLGFLFHHGRDWFSRFLGRQQQ